MTGRVIAPREWIRPGGRNPPRRAGRWVFAGGGYSAPGGPRVLWV